MSEHQPEAPADYWERKAQPVVIREGAEVLAIADAGRVEAAAAVLERRYPHARPDVLDTVISELHSVARAWRRMAGGVLAAAETTPIGPECFADSTGSVISWKGENFYRPGARPGDSPTWEELGLSLTRERDALFAEVCELRDAASTTRLAVNDPEPLVLPPDEFAAFKAVAARFGYPPPAAADLTPAQCDRLDRMVTEYGDATGAVRQAVDLLGARIHSAEDARIIADARDALRVLEGAEAHPEPSGTLAPAPASPERAAAATGPARAKDGSEGGRVTRLCPTCLHDGVLERTLDRAAAAEARLAGIAAMASDAKASAPAGMTAIVAAERVLAAAGGDGETPRPWTAADERRRILAIAECLKSEFAVTACNSEGTRTVTVQAVPYGALRSMALLGDGPGERAGAERLRALGVTGEAQERGEEKGPDHG